MKIEAKITLALDAEERDKLVEAAKVLDNIYRNDIRNVVQFDVGGSSLIDTDDMATMMRKLIHLSDTGAPIPEDLDI